MLKYIAGSVRPYQWYKNLLLFIGLIFSYNILNTSMWTSVVLAFVYFCALSSGEYLINDIIDRERDRRHPVKSQRPIASGRLKVPYALLSALILIVFSLLGAYFTINLYFFLISFAYIILILLYSWKLKHYIIVDVLVIATGFVIRAVAGCLVIGVFISPWLIVCTFLLALFLALGKRRHELVTLVDEAGANRGSLSEYSVSMIEHLLTSTTAALIVSYLMYTFLTDNYYMMLTAPFAIYGLFRYLFLVYQNSFGGEPEVIFKDKAMVITLVIWVLLIILILYEVPSGFYKR